MQMPAGRGMHRHQQNLRREAGGHCRLPRSFIKRDPVVSQMQDHVARPGTIRANLFRSPVQYLEAWVLSLANMSCHPCPSLGFVLEEPTGARRCPVCSPLCGQLTLTNLAKRIPHGGAFLPPNPWLVDVGIS